MDKRKEIFFDFAVKRPLRNKKAPDPALFLFLIP